MKAFRYFLIFIALAAIVILIFRMQNHAEKIKVFRFEKSLFSTEKENYVEHKLVWQRELGTFFSVYNYNVLGVSPKDTNYWQAVETFIQHPDMREAYDSLLLVFPDVDFLEDQLSVAFENYKQQFPQKKTPKVITFFSGFNYGVVTQDTLLLIGLDYFLGRNSSFYRRLQFPDYMMQQCQQKYILPYCMEAIANNEFGHFDEGSTFLDQMIYKGKMMNFVHAMLPNSSMEDKLRYSPDQYRWCEENEKEIWRFFIDKKLLFSTDYKQFNSYLNYAPFAKGMPKQSPGRIAYWLGWKITNKYLENHPETTLEALMQNTDAEQILRDSGYKP